MADDEALDTIVDAKHVDAVGKIGGRDAGVEAIEMEVHHLAAGDVEQGDLMVAFAADGEKGAAGGGVGVDAKIVGEGVGDVLNLSEVHHGHGVEVEATAIAAGGVGVVDDVTEGVARTVLGIDASDHVDDADETDVVDVDVGAVAKFIEVEWGAPTGAVFASKIVDEGGVDGTVGADLDIGGGEGSGGEADEVLTIGADLDESQLEEIVVERVFEHGEIVALTVGDGTSEGKSGAAAVAEADHCEVVARGGSNGSGAVAVGDEGGGVGDVGGTEL